MISFPAAVDVIEVGPRDGFQNVKTFIPTERKIALIKNLIGAGLKNLEVAAFVSPRVMPQMSDAREVLAAVNHLAHCYVLVPNLKGADLALSAGAKALTFVISASQTHNQANTNRTVDDSLRELDQITAICRGISIKLDISTVFGCAYEGQIPFSSVARIFDFACERAIRQIILCDTTGMANPKSVAAMISALRSGSSDTMIGGHFHNARGTALANVLAAIDAGAVSIEASVGGLGGCPFVPDASGNVATEDLINMFDDLGIETGVNLIKLIECSRDMKTWPDMRSDSYTMIAGPTRSQDAISIDKKGEGCV